jgi:hypothetical protein
MEGYLILAVCVANVVGLLVCLYYGPKAGSLCLAGLWLNAILAALVILPTLCMVLRAPSYREDFAMGIVILIFFGGPPLLSSLLFLAIHLWRVRLPKPGKARPPSVAPSASYRDDRLPPDFPPRASS